MQGDSFIAKCSNCGTRNRIPKSRMGDRPLCGKCKRPISIKAADPIPVDITDLTFQSDVIEYQGAVLVDCWAPWCGPCRTVGPVIEQLALEYAGRVRVAKLNVDENRKVAMQYQIMGIPTLLVLKGGELVDRIIGVIPRQVLEPRITRYL